MTSRAGVPCAGRAHQPDHKWLFADLRVRVVLQQEQAGQRLVADLVVVRAAGQPHELRIHFHVVGAAARADGALSAPHAPHPIARPSAPPPALCRQRTAASGSWPQTPRSGPRQRLQCPPCPKSPSAAPAGEAERTGIASSPSPHASHAPPPVFPAAPLPTSAAVSPPVRSTPSTAASSGTARRSSTMASSCSGAALVTLCPPTGAGAPARAPRAPRGAGGTPHEPLRSPCHPHGTAARARCRPCPGWHTAIPRTAPHQTSFSRPASAPAIALRWGV